MRDTHDSIDDSPGGSPPGGSPHDRPDDGASGAVGDPPTAAGAPQTRTRRLPRWLSLALVGAAVVAVLSLGMSLVQLPYYVFSPGPTTSTESLVDVQGTDTTESAGRFLLTTVRLSPADGFGYVRALVDGSRVLVDRDDIDQGRSDDEVDDDNTALMDASKEAAGVAALHCLGSPLTGSGALVLDVSEESPNQGVLEAGDVILEAQGTPISFAAELSPFLADLEPGDTVDLLVERDGEQVQVEVELYEAPDDGRPILGVVVTTEDLDVDSELDVGINTEDIGGPSAGLVYALTILDQILPEDLTDGRVIAATGEIDELGNVGAIGGVTQKSFGVERDAAEIFLVPAGNFDEASATGVDVEIVSVETLDDALDALGAEFSCVPPPT